MKSEKGFSLIEVLVSLTLLGVIAAAFLYGLSTGLKSVLLSEERVAGESLAKSQVEDIKAQDYIPVADYNPLKSYELIDIPAKLAAAGYDVKINPPEIISGAEAYELQIITVVVRRSGKVILAISFYRLGAV
ncbi:hypothetical protein ES703_57721 [subsurface metagenome]